MKWISVNDRLPEKSGKYLVCTNRGNVYQTKFYSYPEETGGHWGQKDKGKSITHWMEMPKPPQEKKPTDLTGKCGSCEYAKPTTEFGRNCYIFCSNFEDLKRNGTARYKQRTTPACKRYVPKGDNNG